MVSSIRTLNDSASWSDVAASRISLLSRISGSGGLRRVSLRGGLSVFVDDEPDEAVSGLFGVILAGCWGSRNITTLGL